VSPCEVHDAARAVREVQDHPVILERFDCLDPDHVMNLAHCSQGHRVVQVL